MIDSRGGKKRIEEARSLEGNIQWKAMPANDMRHGTANAGEGQGSRCLLCAKGTMGERSCGREARTSPQVANRGF